MRISGNSPHNVVWHKFTWDEPQNLPELIKLLGKHKVFDLALDMYKVQLRMKERMRYRKELRKVGPK